MPLPYWRLSGFYFFYFAFLGAFSPYWGLYLKSLDFGPMQIGILMAVLQGVRIFAPTFWGWQADRSGARQKMVQIAAALSLAAYSGVFFGHSFWWLFCVMMLLSFCWSGSLPLVEATTLSHLKENTAFYGRIRSWGSLGFIVAVIGLGHLLDRFQIGMLLWGIFIALSGIFFFSLGIPETERSHQRREPLKEILFRPEVIALFASCFLMSAAHGPYYTFYSIYLAAHGYSKSAIGWLWAIGVICEIGVFFAMPRLLRRFTLKEILAFSLGAAVLRFSLIGWWVESMPLVLFAQVLHAATFGSHHAAAMASVHKIFKGPHEAKGQAFYTGLVYGLGGTVGAFGGGWLWQAHQAHGAFGAAAVAAFLGLCWLLLRFRI